MKGPLATGTRVTVRFSGWRLLALSGYWLAINYLWQGMGALVLPRLIVGMVRAAAWLGAAGTLLLIPASSLLWVYAVDCVVGAAFGVLLSVDWALVTDLVPPAEAGRYMGISKLATAGSGILATAVGGPLLDFGNGLRLNAGFPLLFTFLALALLGGGWLVGRVRVPVTRPSSQ
ncbi:MAG: hypothetical protein ACYDEA_08405 [Candidatus Dormibacteria bacterium]